MKKFRVIFFLIGIAGMAVLVIQSDPAQYDWNRLLSRDLMLILLLQLLLWAVIYTMHILVYKQILGKEHFKKVGWLRMIRICLTGFALNNVTPAGLVGGEPYRIIELKPYCGTKKASSATLTFTVFYTMGHLLLWFTGTVLYFALGAPGEFGTNLILLISGTLCGLACFAFSRSRNHGFIMPFMHFLKKLPFIKKSITKLLGKYEPLYSNIDNEISAYSHSRKRFYITFLLEYATRLLEAAEYFIIFRMLGEAVNYLDGLLIMSTASLLGNLLFMIPMQAGTRESGMALVLHWLKVTEESGFMGGILYRVRELICIAIGIILILIGKRSKEKQAETKPLSPEQTNEQTQDE